jgi:hypothetical protein
MDLLVRRGRKLHGSGCKMTRMDLGDEGIELDSAALGEEGCEHDFVNKKRVSSFVVGCYLARTNNAITC